MRPSYLPRRRGFTLVELMVTVAIAAILLAIGVPTYQIQVRKSRRTEAKTAALDLAAREEKYLSLNNAYSASSVSLGYASTATPWPITIGSGYYQIAVCLGTATGTSANNTTCASTGNGATTGTSYIVAVTPIAGTSQANDSSCQYFVVDNTGTQFSSSAVSTSADTTSTCWQ